MLSVRSINRASRPIQAKFGAKKGLSDNDERWINTWLSPKPPEDEVTRARASLLKAAEASSLSLSDGAVQITPKGKLSLKIPSNALIGMLVRYGVLQLSHDGVPIEFIDSGKTTAHMNDEDMKLIGNTLVEEGVKKGIIKDTNRLSISVSGPPGARFLDINLPLAQSKIPDELWQAGIVETAPPTIMLSDSFFGSDRETLFPLSVYNGIHVLFTRKLMFSPKK